MVVLCACFTFWLTFWHVKVIGWAVRTLPVSDDVTQPKISLCPVGKWANPVSLMIGPSVDVPVFEDTA